MDEKGVEGFKECGLHYAIFKWEDGKTSPVDLLYEYDGWEEYCVITEDEYEYLQDL